MLIAWFKVGLGQQIGIRGKNRDRLGLLHAKCSTKFPSEILGLKPCGLVSETLW